MRERTRALVIGGGPAGRRAGRHIRGASGRAGVPAARQLHDIKTLGHCLSNDRREIAAPARELPSDIHGLNSMA
ncbi:hypothetical protein ACWD6P_02195 [Streptomyces sp. NPDC002446]